MTSYELVTLVLVVLTGHNPFDISYIMKRDKVKWEKKEQERKEKEGSDRFEKLEGAQRLRTNTSIFFKSHFLLWLSYSTLNIDIVISQIPPRCDYS